jgi:hypothetical protein
MGTWQAYSTLIFKVKLIKQKAQYIALHLSVKQANYNFKFREKKICVSFLIAHHKKEKSAKLKYALRTKNLFFYGRVKMNITTNILAKD